MNFGLLTHYRIPEITKYTLSGQPNIIWNNVNTFIYLFKRRIDIIRRHCFTNINY